MTILSPPPILTACLSCGWVHEYPWRWPSSPRLAAIPGFHSLSAEIFRVGKANTLLLTPNDWSTLSNGTVDGEPTGLHRYVGENRFVFVLLNVTDGHGNLVSYDLETKDRNGAYVDLSGNGMTGFHAGDAPEPGRFGRAARLSGSGSYVSTPDTADRLDWINDSFTVSFWIRPDEDYVGGTGWKWSTGREGLWRLGYYNEGTFHGLRFEVKDTAGDVRYNQTAYSLYAGRWVHLAAVMRRVQDPPFTFTYLDLYVNGVRIATKSFNPAFSAMDGATDLRIGHDLPGGGRFKGLVDEFRLYRTALSVDAVRGLPWFLHGANNVLIPRGVFFDSKLFENLNNATQMASGPLAGGNAHGNDNKGTAHLNARVIQMVITKNATLAQAWKVLDLAATNKSNIVTAFALIVTNEFYTLGLAKEVRNLAANVVVENSGNFSAPPPPPTLWQLFWNTLAGFASSAWNALVAVGQFFVNVGRWLVDAFVGILYGLASGNWSYFQQNVLEPLREALEALVKFIVDFITAAVNLIFSPLIDAYNQMQHAAASAAMYAVDPPALSDVLNVFWTAIVLSVFGIFLISALVAIEIVLKMTNAFGFGWIVSLVMGLVIAAFVAVQIAKTVLGDGVEGLFPPGIDDFVEWGFEMSSFLLAFGVLLGAWVRGWKTLGEAAVGLWAVTLSFGLLIVASSFKNRPERQAVEIMVVLDIGALALALLPVSYDYSALRGYSLLNPVAKGLGFAAFATSTASLLHDLHALTVFPNPAP